MDSCTGTCKSLDCLHARKRLRSCTERSMSTVMESFLLRLEKMSKQWSVAQWVYRQARAPVENCCLFSAVLNRDNLSLYISSKKNVVSFLGERFFDIGLSSTRKIAFNPNCATFQELANYNLFPSRAKNALVVFFFFSVVRRTMEVHTLPVCDHMHLPVRISTSALHHWILLKKIIWTELMILECSFRACPHTSSFASFCHPVQSFCGESGVSSQNGFHCILDTTTECARPP